MRVAGGMLVGLAFGGLMACGGSARSEDELPLTPHADAAAESGDAYDASDFDAPDAAVEDALTDSEPSEVGADTAGDAAGPIEDPCSVPAAWLGSWDLRFDAIFGRTSHAADIQPNLGQTARLDLRCVQGELKAAVHPRDANVAAYDVMPTVWPDRIELMNSVYIPINDPTGTLWGSDVWQSFVLKLGAAGIPETFLAEGVSQWFWYDTSGAYDTIFALGAVAPDTTAPIIEPARIVRKAGPPELLLPWDDVIVKASEPLDLGALAGLSLVHTDSSGQPSAAEPWEPVLPDDPVGLALWAGTARFMTHLASWTDEAPFEHTLSLLQPVPDFEGNPASVATSSWVVVALPKVQSSLDFSSSQSLLLWGPAQTYQGGAQPGTLCDDADCLVIGPIGYGSGGSSPTACVQRSGMAARIHTAGATTLSLRIRLHAAVAGTAGIWGSNFAPYFHMDVVMPDGSRSTQEVDASQHWLSDPLPPSGWYPATDWFDVEITLPASGDEAGVVVWSGVEYGTGEDCLNFDGFWYALAVDAIAAGS